MVQNEDCPLCRLALNAIKSAWTAIPSVYPRGLLNGTARPKCSLRSCEATTAEVAVRSIELIIHDGDNVITSTGTGGRQLFEMELRLHADDACLPNLANVGHRRKIQPVCQLELSRNWYENAKPNTWKIVRNRESSANNRQTCTSSMFIKC